MDNQGPHNQATGESGEANSQTLQVESRAKRDGTLKLIVFLTVLSAILFLWSWDDIGFTYLPLMTALMLLFNHIAFFTTQQGRIHRLMKTVARVWIVFVGGCLIWALNDLIRLTIN